MKIKIPFAINHKVGITSIIISIILSWLIKDGFTFIVLGGKSFNGRNLFMQLGILGFLIIIISTLSYFILSIIFLVVSRNYKLNSWVMKLIFPNNGMMLPDKKIDLLCLIIVIGFFSAVAFHYYMGSYLGRSYPYNTFLFSPNDHFNDFFNVLRGSF